MAKYQGHRSWNAWNIHLWISNDYELYLTALGYIENAPTLAVAARRMAKDYAGCKTPDGARFNLTCIREAMRDLS